VGNTGKDKIILVAPLVGIHVTAVLDQIEYCRVVIRSQAVGHDMSYQATDADEQQNRQM
jgi:hypothetical protein